MLLPPSPSPTLPVGSTGHPGIVVAATHPARIPAVGDTVDLDGWHLTVEAVEHNRADRVRMTAPASAAHRAMEEAR
ncbi:membrane protein [Streptomyces alboflavus]|uniref:Membrane protein n=1 Tax=Streptomyces alboflavus TaxID=67267 RepID=A0A1Z1WPP9_9ACTN|nr:membrane protein [Streptomyces alboflavus]